MPQVLYKQAFRLLQQDGTPYLLRKEQITSMALYYREPDASQTNQFTKTTDFNLDEVKNYLWVNLPPKTLEWYCVITVEPLRTIQTALHTTTFAVGGPELIETFATPCPLEALQGHSPYIDPIDLYWYQYDDVNQCYVCTYIKGTGILDPTVPIDHPIVDYIQTGVMSAVTSNAVAGLKNGVENSINNLTNNVTALQEKRINVKLNGEDHIEDDNATIDLGEINLDSYKDDLRMVTGEYERSADGYYAKHGSVLDSQDNVFSLSDHRYHYESNDLGVEGFVNLCNLNRNNHLSVTVTVYNSTYGGEVYIERRGYDYIATTTSEYLAGVIKIYQSGLNASLVCRGMRYVAFKIVIDSEYPLLWSGKPLTNLNPTLLRDMDVFLTHVDQTAEYENIDHSPYEKETLDVLNYNVSVEDCQFYLNETMPNPVTLKFVAQQDNTVVRVEDSTGNWVAVTSAMTQGTVAVLSYQTPDAFAWSYTTNKDWEQVSNKKSIMTPSISGSTVYYPSIKLLTDTVSGATEGMVKSVTINGDNYLPDENGEVDLGDVGGNPENFNVILRHNKADGRYIKFTMSPYTILEIWKTSCDRAKLSYVVDLEHEETELFEYGCETENVNEICLYSIDNVEYYVHIIQGRITFIDAEGQTKEITHKTVGDLEPVNVRCEEPTDMLWLNSKTTTSPSQKRMNAGGSILADDVNKYMYTCNLSADTEFIIARPKTAYIGTIDRLFQITNAKANDYTVTIKEENGQVLDVVSIAKKGTTNNIKYVKLHFANGQWTIINTAVGGGSGPINAVTSNTITNIENPIYGYGLNANGSNLFAYDNVNLTDTAGYWWLAFGKNGSQQDISLTMDYDTAQGFTLQGENYYPVQKIKVNGLVKEYDSTLKGFDLGSIGGGGGGLDSVTLNGSAHTVSNNTVDLGTVKIQAGLDTFSANSNNLINIGNFSRPVNCKLKTNRAGWVKFSGNNSWFDVTVRNYEGTVRLVSYETNGGIRVLYTESGNRLNVYFDKFNSQNFYLYYGGNCNYYVKVNQGQLKITDEEGTEHTIHEYDEESNHQYVAQMETGVSESNLFLVRGHGNQKGYNVNTNSISISSAEIDSFGTFTSTNNQDTTIALGRPTMFVNDFTRDLVLTNTSTTSTVRWTITNGYTTLMIIDVKAGDTVRTKLEWIGGQISDRADWRCYTNTLPDTRYWNATAQQSRQYFQLDFADDTEAIFECLGRQVRLNSHGGLFLLNESELQDTMWIYFSDATGLTQSCIINYDYQLNIKVIRGSITVNKDTVRAKVITPDTHATVTIDAYSSTALGQWQLVSGYGDDSATLSQHKKYHRTGGALSSINAYMSVPACTRQTIHIIETLYTTATPTSWTAFLYGRDANGNNYQISRQHSFETTYGKEVSYPLKWDVKLQKWVFDEQ